jgi:hypothetical protein
MALQSSNPLKVLHVLGQLEYGGVSTWIKTLIDADTEKYLHIDICCNFRKQHGGSR